MATITVRPVNPPGPAVNVRYAGPPERSGGVGVWDDIARDGRDPAVEYTGQAPDEMRVPVLVNGIDADGYGKDRSVEPKIKQLEAFGRRTEKTGEPPVLRLSGPIRHGGMQWVLADLERGPYEVTRTGTTIKAEFVLVLKRYVAADVLLSPAKRSGKATGKKARTTTVVKSDLRQGLAAVSARVYGTTSKAKAIAKLNGIRDPKHIRVGQVLRLP